MAHRMPMVKMLDGTFKACHELFHWGIYKFMQAGNWCMEMKHTQEKKPPLGIPSFQTEHTEEFVEMELSDLQLTGKMQYFAFSR